MPTHHQLINKRLINESVPGPREHQGDWKAEFCLDLKNVPMPDLKLASPEDAFIARGVQSRCNAKFFRHEYKFSAYMLYDEGCVCISMPSLNQEICILPVVNPDSIGFKPPVDWAPTSLGCMEPEVKHLH